MKITIIKTIIATTLVIVFAYHAYTVYQFKTVLAQHELVLGQIVQLINSNQPKK